MTSENQETEQVKNEEVVTEQELETDVPQDDELASTDEGNDDEQQADNDTSDESQDDSTQKPSKGLDKRLSKLLAENERDKTELWQLRRELDLLKSQQQSFQNQPQSIPTADPKLDPSSDQFDLVAFNLHIAREAVKQEFKAQQDAVRREEATKTVVSDFNSVEEKINRARANDSSFDTIMQRYEKMITPDMKYGLSSLENPVAYLKHIFKNEKDVRSFLSISTRHPSEQVKLVTKLGLQFELPRSGAKPQATSTKPKPIPQIGKGSAFGSKPGYNEKTGTWDRDAVNSFINS